MEFNNISFEKLNFDYLSNQPVFAKVIESEFCNNRLEHEELVQLDNGITLELKWGGPFRQEDSYQVGEEVRLAYENNCLIVTRYRMNQICQEGFYDCGRGYYISDR